VSGVLAAIGLHLFLVLYEEPILRSRFSAEYELHRSRLSRFVPHTPLPSRLSPWAPPPWRQKTASLVTRPPGIAERPTLTSGAWPINMPASGTA